MANELVVKGKSLKDRLDCIEKQVNQKAHEGYFISRLSILLGSWYKGKAIYDSHYREGKMRVSWNSLSKETGRRDVSLKSWFVVYFKNQEYDKYEKKARLKAKSWANLALLKDKCLALPEQQQPLTIDFKPPIITQASYKDWLPKQDDCDLVLTDPPYSTDVTDIDAFASDWLPMALNKVKDTGSAYVFIGAYPREYKAYLNVKLPKHINITNILIWTYKNTLGPNPGDHYIQNYQACLYYRGIHAPALNTDVLMNKISVYEYIHPARSKDRFFEWQKPDELAQLFINNSSKEGDIVLDPFAGSGTFILMANRLNRLGFGCEMNPDVVDIAKKRGCKNGK